MKRNFSSFRSYFLKYNSSTILQFFFRDSTDEYLESESKQYFLEKLFFAKIILFISSLYREKQGKPSVEVSLMASALESNESVVVTQGDKTKRVILKQRLAIQFLAVLCFVFLMLFVWQLTTNVMGTKVSQLRTFSLDCQGVNLSSRTW